MRSLVTLVLLLVARPSDACENSRRITTDEQVKLVSTLERRVLDGDYANIEEVPFTDLHHEKLVRRADIAVHTALLRRDGDFETVLAYFPDYLKGNPKDVLLQARLAEAQARGTKAQRQQARQTLEDLAARDLLTEPEAWATLARLRAAAKDVRGAVSAAHRCTKMTTRKGVCPAISAR